jgi:hypothetical protein
MPSVADQRSRADKKPFAILSPDVVEKCPPQFSSYEYVSIFAYFRV